MNKVVVSVIGKDRSGIVSEVTGILYRHHCSIEDSSMTILEGNFVMIMIVALPNKTRLNLFQKKIKVLEKKSGLIISVQELKQKPRIGPILHKGRPFILSVLGSDKPGIVHRVTKVLAERRINITDLNTKVIGREGDRNAYAMVLELEVPQLVKESVLAGELKNLGKALKVDITLKPIESLTL